MLGRSRAEFGTKCDTTLSCYEVIYLQKPKRSGQKQIEASCERDIEGTPRLKIFLHRKFKRTFKTLGRFKDVSIH